MKNEVEYKVEPTQSGRSNLKEILKTFSEYPSNPSDYTDYSVGLREDILNKYLNTLVSEIKSRLGKVSLPKEIDKSPLTIKNNITIPYTRFPVKMFHSFRIICDKTLNLRNPATNTVLKPEEWEQESVTWDNPEWLDLSDRIEGQRKILNTLVPACTEYTIKSDLNNHSAILETLDNKRWIFYAHDFMPDRYQDLVSAKKSLNSAVIKAFEAFLPDAEDEFSLTVYSKVWNIIGNYISEAFQAEKA